MSLFSGWIAEDLYGFLSTGTGGGGPEPEPEPEPQEQVPGADGTRRRKRRKRKRVAGTDWVSQLRAANEQIKKERGEDARTADILPFPANRADAFKLYAERTPLDLTPPPEPAVEALAQEVEAPPPATPILTPEQARNAAEFGMETLPPPPEQVAPPAPPPPNDQAMAAELQGQVARLTAMLNRVGPELQTLRRQNAAQQREIAALRHELQLRAQNDDNEAMAVIMRALNEEL
jgi:hypothetical protein